MQPSRSLTDFRRNVFVLLPYSGSKSKLCEEAEHSANFYKNTQHHIPDNSLLGADGPGQVTEEREGERVFLK
jgi:hypothetical protein